MKKISTLVMLLFSFIIFSQVPCNSTNPGNNFQGARQCSANNNWSAANDFAVPADTKVTLKAVLVSLGMNAGVTATNVRVRIYNDANGKPGTLMNSQAIVPTSQVVTGTNYGVNFSNVLVNINPYALAGAAGSSTPYWVAIQVTTSNGSTAYMETTQASMKGAPLAFSDGGAFIIPSTAQDGVYTFYTDCEPLIATEFPAPYCGPLLFPTVEPITLVNVGGINNTSSASVNGSPGHENFTAKVGEMKRGMTYPISLDGNTAGNFENRFIVYVDWNQNNDLTDEGEMYVIEQSLINSTGTGDKMITGNIAVPANAKLGMTRMRVKKTYTGPFTNPCTTGTDWGQAEDYSINVTENLAVTDNSLITGFSFYPNPSADILNLRSAKSIEKVEIYNMAGQHVQTTKIGATSAVLNISKLKSGVYILKVTADGKTGSYKLLKK